MFVRRSSLTGAAALAVVALFGACSTEPDLVPTSVIVSDSSITLTALNATARIGAAVLDQHDDPLEAAVTWTSSDPLVATVATVGDSAQVTAVANGTAQLTAAAGEASFSVAVSVAQAPKTMTKVSGDLQSGQVGQALVGMVTVQVNDSLGSPIQAVSVLFSPFGGSSVNPANVATGADGRCSTTWTLGGIAGSQSLQASVSTAGVAPANFTASATVGSAAAIAGVFPTTVRGTASALIAQPFVVRVTDQFGNPVAGASVSFAVTSGGGSVGTALANSASDGTAQTIWTLGPVIGDQALQASTPGVLPYTFTTKSSGTPFTISLRLMGSATATQAAAFMAAADRWESILTADLADVDFVAFPVGPGQCGTNAPAIAELVDDVLIFVTLEPIDGPSGILASAGPCFIRTTGRLTVVGLMRFDVADLATLESAGSLNTVILHEMGHVLGFGSLWSQTEFNCLQNSSSPGVVLDTYFSCATAVATFNAIGGTSYTGGNKVPVENCGPLSPTGCGIGTVNSHWREPVFVEEVMTGYITVGIVNPLSTLTIAAMSDLGYSVNYAPADPYTRTFTIRATGGAAARTEVDLGDDVYRGPIFVVDRTGRVTAVIRQ